MQTQLSARIFYRYNKKVIETYGMRLAVPIVEQACLMATPL
jgi:hypothetical protein